MPNQATITGVAGPGRQVTGAPIANVSEVHLNFNDRRIHVFYEAAPNFVTEVEMTNSTTVTLTNTGGNWSVVIA
jgi:hypothetical protein